MTSRYSAGGSSAGEYSVAVAKRKTALVVDDEESVREAVASALVSSGFKVTLAASGDEALTEFRALGPWSLVVLDIDLGEGPSGLDVLREIRRDHPALPIVVISGTESYRTVAQERAFFLLKPFHFATLQQLIAEAVD